MKFIVRSKNGYGQSIKDDIIRMLEKAGAGWTERIEPGCDFAIIVGGDGTLLRDHWMLDCPVLGINPGPSIGFYMLACAKDYRKRVESLLNGKPGRDYFVHDHMTLEASVNGKPLEARALNEVLVSPVYVRRLLDSRLAFGGKKSLERNSGVIVYTPTGSHAFAHSAGAKKLPSGSRKIGITGLAPYSGRLKEEEMLCASCPVTIECLCHEGEACMDGSEVNLRKLEKGDKVTVDKSEKTLKLVGFGRKFGQG